MKSALDFRIANSGGASMAIFQEKRLPFVFDSVGYKIRLSHHMTVVASSKANNLFKYKKKVQIINMQSFVTARKLICL